jgi:WD40 repeat protein
VSGGSDGVELVDAASGKTTPSPFVTSGDSNNVVTLAWSPDGGTVAAVLDDQSVRLYDGQTLGELAQPLPASSTSVYRVAWSPDGTELAVDSDEPLSIFHSWSEDSACRYLKQVMTTQAMDAELGAGGALSECAHGNVAVTAPIPILDQPLPDG